MMKVYKFRSTEQMAFIFDILLNKRLYCSSWKDLNDPMEGMFTYQYDREEESDTEKKVKGIIESKQKYKICSLSSTYDNHLLWAHYANGFDGVAIEIELQDNNDKIKPIDYDRGVFAHVNIQQQPSEDQAAQDILFSKNKVWKYEEEIRILHDSEYFDDFKITRLVVGHRVQEALFKVLNMICSQLDIPFGRVGIGDEGIDIDRIDPLKIEELNLKDI